MPLHAVAEDPHPIYFRETAGPGAAVWSLAPGPIVSDWAFLEGGRLALVTIDGALYFAVSPHDCLAAARAREPDVQECSWDDADARMVEFGPFGALIDPGPSGALAARLVGGGLLVIAGQAGIWRWRSRSAVERSPSPVAWGPGSVATTQDLVVAYPHSAGVSIVVPPLQRASYDRVPFYPQYLAQHDGRWVMGGPGWVWPVPSGWGDEAATLTTSDTGATYVVVSGSRVRRTSIDGELDLEAPSRPAGAQWWAPSLIGDQYLAWAAAVDLDAPRVFQSIASGEVLCEARLPLLGGIGAGVTDDGQIGYLDEGVLMIVDPLHDCIARRTEFVSPRLGSVAGGRGAFVVLDVAGTAWLVAVESGATIGPARPLGALESVGGLAVSPDRASVAVLSNDRDELTVWELPRAERTWSVNSLDSRSMSSVRWSASGETLCLFEASGRARAFRADDGEEFMDVVDAGHSWLYCGDDRMVSTTTSSEEPAVVTWRSAAATASQQELIWVSGAGSNLRRCPGSFRVVPVVPFPDPMSVTAPEEACLQWRSVD